MKRKKPKKLAFQMWRLLKIFKQNLLNYFFFKSFNYSKLIHEILLLKMGEKKLDHIIIFIVFHVLQFQKVWK